MDDIRKERLVLSIVTLAGVAIILQNHLGGWEFWVPPVIIAGIIIQWFLHIAQKLEFKARIYLYFAFSAFALFYLGIHDTILFDLSVALTLL
ncbi:MAG: hypothetical protein K6E63_09155, partial [Lachnospiraceae bacterium]|nr:hypothetical protein [Lachnospiraceae bacterium]